MGGGDSRVGPGPPSLDPLDERYVPPETGEENMLGGVCASPVLSFELLLGGDCLSSKQAAGPTNPKEICFRAKETRPSWSFRVGSLGERTVRPQGRHFIRALGAETRTAPQARRTSRLWPGSTKRTFIWHVEATLLCVRLSTWNYRFLRFITW